MDYELRPGRPADKAGLAQWTTHTFAWGDYVVDSFDTWLEHPQSCVLVGADDADQPIAVGRGVMLSPDELWLQGVRVHPEWRRLGVASELGGSLEAWGADRGAKVALLMTEDWNEAARRQVEAVGFRTTATWHRAFRPTEHSGRVGMNTPSPADPLQRAGAAEVAPAFQAWSQGELNRAARSMMAVSWQWRRLHVADLERAAEHGAFLAGQTGWAIAAPRNNNLEVGWMQTSRENAAAHLEALLGVAVNDEAAALTIMMPDVDWLLEAATVVEFELEQLLLFEKPL